MSTSVTNEQMEAFFSVFEDHYVKSGHAYTKLQAFQKAIAPLLTAQPASTDENIVAVRVHGPAATTPWQDAKERDPESGQSMLDGLRELHAASPPDVRAVTTLEYAYACPQPNSGTSPGDGSVREGACRVEGESP